MPKSTVTVPLLPLATAKSALPSPLKSPTVTAAGSLPTAGVEEFAKLSAATPEPSVCEPSTALPFDVSKNDTVPVGDRLALPVPTTVPVNV